MTRVDIDFELKQKHSTDYPLIIVSAGNVPLRQESADVICLAEDKLADTNKKVNREDAD